MDLKQKTTFTILSLAAFLTFSHAAASAKKSSLKPSCSWPAPSQYVDPHPELSIAQAWAAEVKTEIDRSFNASTAIEKPVHCHLIVNADGSIKTAKIVKSSGDPKLDRRALDFLRAQAPLPKPRNSLAQKTGLRVWFKPEIGTIDVVSEAWLKQEHLGL
jgi:TonB family C-terminal domain